MRISPEWVADPEGVWHLVRSQSARGIGRPPEKVHTACRRTFDKPPGRGLSKPPDGVAIHEECRQAAGRG